ncbi:MAG: DNA polymerase III subunit delta' [Rikenellaceae bacterium]|nr:DNA polymerase III subunit delta' [Rikenellaceae bacterium]
MQFKDILGHQKLKEKLIRTVTSGRISHALLFSGDEGSGALPLAIAYSAYINCESPTETDSCGICRSCKLMADLSHPDVHYVYPVNKSKSARNVGGTAADKPISDNFLHVWREIMDSSVPKGYFGEQDWYKYIEIDNKQGAIGRNEAADIIKKLSFKSFVSPYKVIILWLPERMNDQSANALLKILEEPWEKTLFIFVSESPKSILKTILSRTQEVHVPAVEPETITEFLLNNSSIDSEDAEVFGRISAGNVIRAVSLANSGDDVEDTDFELFAQLMRYSFNDRHLELLEWAETVSSMGREAQKNLIAESLKLLREAYILSIGIDRISYLYGKRLDFCRKFAPYVNSGNIDQLSKEFGNAIKNIMQNGNPKIVFTHFVLSVSKLINKI